MTDERPLFHELDVPAFLAANQTMTWGDVAAQYRQPDWCGYPGALRGVAGCWSLVAGMVDGEDYCRDCECHGWAKPSPITDGADHG